jgi:hypothetical protein
MIRESFIALLIVLLSTVLGLDMTAKTDTEGDSHAQSQNDVAETDATRKITPSINS